MVVIDVTEKEINARMSVRGAARPGQTVFDRSWNRIDDSVWNTGPPTAPVFKRLYRLAKSGASRARPPTFNMEARLVSPANPKS